MRISTRIGADCHSLCITNGPWELEFQGHPLPLMFSICPSFVPNDTQKRCRSARDDYIRTTARLYPEKCTSYYIFPTLYAIEWDCMRSLEKSVLNDSIMQRHNGEKDSPTAPSKRDSWDVFVLHDTNCPRMVVEYLRNPLKSPCIGEEVKQVDRDEEKLVDREFFNWAHSAALIFRHSTSSKKKKKNVFEWGDVTWRWWRD